MSTTATSQATVCLNLPYYDHRRADKARVLVDASTWAVLGHRHWVVLTDKDTGGDSYVVSGPDLQHPRYLHREAHFMRHGAIGEGKVVDHRNRVRTDCTLANLRACTRSQNSCNRDKPQKRKGGPSTSRWKGVWRKKPRVLKSGKPGTDAKPWVCEVAVKGQKQKHTSTHATELEAALKYNEIASEWMGDYANLNPVPQPASPPPGASSVAADLLAIAGGRP